MSRREAGQRIVRLVCTVQQALQKTLWAGTGMRSIGLYGMVGASGAGIVGETILGGSIVDGCVYGVTLLLYPLKCDGFISRGAPHT
jgi:hypothetical protein